MKRYDPDYEWEQDGTREYIKPYMEEHLEGDYVKAGEVIEFLKEIKKQLDVLDDRNLSKLDDTKDELKDMIEDLS